MKALLRSLTSDLSPLYVQPSTRLGVVSGYFTVMGGVVLLLAGSMSVAALLGWAPARFELGGRVAPLLVVVGTGLGWLWTGRLLGRRERAGGLLAIATLVLPIAAWALGEDVSGASLAISALGVLAVASAWRELR